MKYNSRKDEQYVAWPEKVDPKQQQNESERPVNPPAPILYKSKVKAVAANEPGTEYWLP